MAALIVEVDAIPANAIDIFTMEVVWQAPREFEVRRTSMEAVVYAYENGNPRPRRVVIRRGLHSETFDRNGKLVQDPSGYHYTAEMRLGMAKWRTWHHYFTWVNNAWVHNLVIPKNPVAWESIASYVKPSNSTDPPKSYNIRIGKLNGTYYCKFLA